MISCKLPKKASKYSSFNKKIFLMSLMLAKFCKSIFNDPISISLKQQGIELYTGFRIEGTDEFYIFTGHSSSIESYILKFNFKEN